MALDGDQELTLGYSRRMIGGWEILLDAEGFMVDPTAWNEDVANGLAAGKGIQQLSPEQWRVIRFIRDYYLSQGKAPLIREVKAGLQLSVLELDGLFPGGIREGARLVAGLPNPKSCA
jgi:dissimilatory sulfite reductase related protein